MMDEVETKLNILIDCLRKKENALTEIANITLNQENVLENRELFHAMNTEKQTHIKIVLQCDTMFERILKEIGPMLDANPSLYKDPIKVLQEYIRRVMDLDVNIRVHEEQNNMKLQRQKMVPKDKPIVINTQTNAQVIKSYAENVKKSKG